MNTIATTAIRTTDTPRAAVRAGEHATVDLRIGGMNCPHCPANVEEALNRATSTAHVTYDASRAQVVDLLKAIRTAGYACMRTGRRPS